ncbi:MAG: CRISPR-associated helicase Cas3' [Verrucomicrobiae bacterium]|nr:CRISPR-associated helicase Cas3' [Verrucomicrobiae bacterium]
MICYAHTAQKPDGSPDGDQTKWQPLAEHLRGVAALAGEFARPLGLETEAELAGLLHDLGKYSQRFQERLRNPKIHGIKHWAFGAGQAQAMKAAQTAYAVDGHHTGLPAFGDWRQTLLKLADTNLVFELTGCRESLSDLLARFYADRLVFPSIPPVPGKDHFANALRTRFLFSCLVDADFLDTERHFDAETGGRRAVPPLQAEQNLEILLAHLNAKSTEGPINRLRRQLLADCLTAAEKQPGLFTLTAPTGSGKTLSSLAFALKHIAAHNANLPVDDSRRFRRIIVVIPYTSIIEQTARVCRELFEPIFGTDYVLEHHSAVAPREFSDDIGRDAEEERLRRARLASENWAAPIIVTTSVQFFESLFNHKPSGCRKLHNMARSVVIFDEVQTLPSRLVPSLLSGVKLLTRDYGVTAVFMTATQPAFAAAKAALPYVWNPVEISSNPNAMADLMQRTRIELPEPEQKLSWSELAAKLVAQSQTLCVVNTTKDARELFRLLPAEDRFHLSARMCPAHRQMKLRVIRERLAEGMPCRLVSTQLIEAGVDVDFPVAFRALGPLDSIIQTAGRCNREGRHCQPCPVVVFRTTEGNAPPGAYRTAVAKTEEFLFHHPNAPLHQPEVYRQYFAELYGLLGPQSVEDDPVFVASKAFDFPKAAAECRVVGEETLGVLVKWEDGIQLTEKLHRQKHFTADECRRAQRFSINLYQGEFQKALANGWLIQPAPGWDFYVWNSHYDEDLGACHPESVDLVV